MKRGAARLLIPAPLQLALVSLLALAGLLVEPRSANAQDTPLTGFRAGVAAVQREAEARLVTAIAPAELDSLSRALTRQPRVAGSSSADSARDWVLARKQGWGLETEAKVYEVFLPWATSVELELTAPVRRRFELSEPPVPDDPATLFPQYPLANGYSGAGEVEAELIYLNYGLHEDYAVLDSLGVDVSGKVVLARYGRSYRGIKAQLAEARGAAGVILYTDPMDDGYFRGIPYPEGAHRPATGVQRGSVMIGAGDPTTPGRPSVPGARRVQPGSSPGFALPTVPVIAVGASVAEALLRELEGGEVPRQSWQGALPFRYRSGPGPARVRLRVTDDRSASSYKEISNTIAWLRGSERPDEWVIVGAHRDAWGAGANDNASGTAAVLAAARALAELTGSALAGGSDAPSSSTIPLRPRRTIVFATWDAEEWGLIGSTEWVEELARELGVRAVAYINQDAVAGGPTFSAAASPSLKRLVREAARAVPAPSGAVGATVYSEWREHASESAAAQDVGLGNLGGGSDFAPFYNHLGIPSAGWGFGGGGGQYHSAYDSDAWMRRFGDPAFERHTAAARLTAVVALRLANADVLPYDYVEFARELRGEVVRLATLAGERRLGDIGLAAVDSAFLGMAEAAQVFANVRDTWLRGPADGAADWRRADEANRQLMFVERALVRPHGLPGRSWYRNLVFASDARDGYATLALPALAEAVRSGDAAAARREIAELVRHVRAATGHIRAATASLRGESVADPTAGRAVGG